MPMKRMYLKKVEISSEITKFIKFVEKNNKMFAKGSCILFNSNNRSIKSA
jgi:hypothetical protein